MPWCRIGWAWPEIGSRSVRDASRVRLKTPCCRISSLMGPWARFFESGREGDAACTLLHSKRSPMGTPPFVRKKRRAGRNPSHMPTNSFWLGNCGE